MQKLIYCTLRGGFLCWGNQVQIWNMAASWLLAVEVNKWNLGGNITWSSVLSASVTGHKNTLYIHSYLYTFLHDNTLHEKRKLWRTKNTGISSLCKHLVLPWSVHHKTRNIVMQLLLNRGVLRVLNIENCRKNITYSSPTKQHLSTPEISEY